MLAQLDRHQRRRERGRERDRAARAKTQQRVTYEQRTRQLGERHAHAQRSQPVVDRQETGADQVYGGRLRGGDAAVQIGAAQQLASRLGVDAVGEVPVGVALPEPEQAELDHEAPEQRREDARLAVQARGLGRCRQCAQPRAQAATACVIAGVSRRNHSASSAAWQPDPAAVTA